MVDTVTVALMISASVIMVGFIADYLFKKTRIPDMLILIFIGALAGPILGAVDPGAVQSFAPYIAALALVYILFDGGMGLTIHKVMSHSPRAVVLALIAFTFSVLITTLITIVAFGVPLLYGLLFGSICGGSSSIVVISLANKIKLSEKASTTLILESAITDILCIVVSLAIIGFIATGQTNYSVVAIEIGSKFLVGAGIGVFVGLIWLLIMRLVNSLPFSYILTLAVVLFAYAFSESLGGSDALSALLFGLVLGNEQQILTFFKLSGNGEVAITDGLRRFESEVAFLIRTFFFVFLGIIASFSSISFLLVGVLVSVMLFVTRYGAIWISTIRSEMRSESKLMTSILTRGLAAAVLATLPAQYGLPYADLFVNTTLVVIVSTAIIATIGVVVYGNENGIKTFKIKKLRNST
ncbi:MAG: cation:proton antiporter [Candidatus Bathyarchaeota archaeon]|nr:cation:proton antiporter [Candidatus Bathyarchaeota archaeon]